MTHPRRKQKSGTTPAAVRFQKKLLPLLIGMAFIPQGASAQLKFAQSPPGNVESYVAPNVILSLDDSGSMAWGMGGSKDKSTSRANILKKALKDVFDDTELLPDGKIRLAWQSMHNHTQLNGKKLEGLSASMAQSATAPNAMRSLQGEHRTNFLAYADKYTVKNGTPTHKLMRQADEYMRAPIHQNGPWADVPGEKLVNDPEGKRTKPLGCRRNYHILMTDGEWNTFDEADMALGNYSNTSHFLLSKNKEQSRLYQIPATNYFKETIEYIYPDGSHSHYKYKDHVNAKTTIADWALKSWAEQLQDPSKFDGELQPLPAYKNAPNKEKITNRHTRVSFEFEKFWNPKYDSADWPHMATFTIGFSNAAIPKENYLKGGNSTVPMKQPTSNGVPFGYDGDLAEYANGIYEWHAGKHPQLDMWHASLSGRGKFYSVTKGEDLKKAFTDIIQTINTDVEPSISGVAASGSNTQRHNVGLYVTGYDPGEGWSGYISAHTFQAADHKIVKDWGGKTTAELLDSSDSNTRVILTASGDKRNGVPFKWDSLGAEEKKRLGSDAATPVAESGEKIVNYIRGDTTLQGSDEAKPFRTRTSRQGDIVNSDIWYIAEPIDVTLLARKGYGDFAHQYKDRTPMLYVGGNDGMLHGFSATDGTEKIAYVPHGLLSEVPRLSQSDFDNNHRYFVDGSPFTGDVFVDNTWKTMLVGTLGGGGKGYFVLDVTDPTQFKDSNAAKLVVKDMTAPPDDSENEIKPAEPGDGWLGHIFSKPVMDDNSPQRTVQIAQLNNGRWAAVLGNGYGSTNGKAALIIQYLDGKKEMQHIPVQFSGSANASDAHNGLSAPRLVDINGDGRPDIAYAGDLQGNMWKFLINTKEEHQWTVANWSNGGKGPLFTADRGSNPSENVNHSTRQAITAAPSVKKADRSIQTTDTNGNPVTTPVVGMMVSFGTGRNVTTADPGEQQRQTLYTVLDNTRYKLEKNGNKPTGHVLVCDDMSPPCNNLMKDAADLPKSVQQSELVERSIIETPVHEQHGRKFWELDTKNVLDYAKHKGWFMDFPEDGQRLLRNMSFYDGSNLLEVFSQIPASGSSTASEEESCESSSVSASKQFITRINIQDGKPSAEPLVRGAPAGINPAHMEMFPNYLSFYTLLPDGTAVRTMLDAARPDEAIVDGAARQDDHLMRVEPLRPSWRQF